ncbi:MAG: T9SS type A sorting domain-containing protein [Bacteroidales bacterium]|nr:T9SS type A sorting domain-containing protein [Bacteroidales bacterium]
MKNLLLTAICILIYIGTFAQFGGGTGTETDPYRIYTIAHLEEIGDSLNNNNDLYGKHLRLMNDIIEDSLANMLGNPECVGFCGSLHGGGHTLALNIESDYYYISIFYNIGDVSRLNDDAPNGYIDSLTIVGNLLSSSHDGGGFCINNFGTIYQCVSKLRINNICWFGGIVCGNVGNIISCTNYTSASYPTVGGICCWSSGNIIDCKNYGNFKIYGEATGGICALSYGYLDYSSASNIIGCTNYGNISSDQSAEYGCYSVGGIVGGYSAVYVSQGMYQGNWNVQRKKIINCQNYGTIDAQSTYWVGGIVGDMAGNANIEQCSNYGEVIGEYNVGGIVGNYMGNDSTWIIGEGYTYPRGGVFNCYNSGHIHGDSIVGGIAGSFASNCGDTLANCLNTGLVDGSAVYSGCYSFNSEDEDLNFYGDSIYLDHNYYDAQMLAYNADNEEGMYEWKFTSQLTGNTPELRAMLGEGWSYADGRYPIPLGLENDSLAMLFATPIYLYAENADDYDDVDLVQHHFTVGTENSVSWASGSRLSIVGENATILASGSENITASLAGYSFTRRLNLINPVSIEEQGFDDVKVFPNPTSDILNITSSETIFKIEIVNVMGQVVKRIEVNSDNAVCDVNDLKAGIYMVRIYNNPLTEPVEVAVSQRKFIKE